jgi:CubicO group peptidase (beta-lactamase class C family)
MQRILLPLLLFITGIVAAQNISTPYDRYLAKEKHRRTFNGAALVVRRGEVLLNKAYGMENIEEQRQNDTTTLFRIGSLSKAFTSTAILMLQEQNKLRLSDTVSKYLPAYPNGGKITIEQLLSHTAGVFEYLQVKEITELADDAPPIDLDKLISHFSEKGLTIRPGEKFAYSNSNYILLAAIVEKITGEKFEGVVRRLILDPLQMKNTGFDFIGADQSQKATGYLAMATARSVADFDSTYAPGCGSMYSTTGDIYLFYQAIRNNTLMREESKQDAFTKRKGDYGLGWFNERKQQRTCISHAGGVPGFVANLQFYPGEDLCVIVLSNDMERDIFTDSDNLARIALKNDRSKRDAARKEKILPGTIRGNPARYSTATNSLTE